MIRSLPRRLLLWLLPLSFLLPGCAATRPLPTQAPPAVEVKVPVPVPCEIEQVPEARLPQAARGMGIYGLARVGLAQRRLLLAEVERRRAAMRDPCPAGTAR